MKAFGQHLLAEYRGCDCATLNDLERIETLLRRAAEVAGASIVASVFHPFTPQGVTGVVVVEESHLSIHTWPEHGYAAVDFYTCGDCAPERANDFLREELGAATCEVMKVERGIEAERSMAVKSHMLEGEDLDTRRPLPGIVDTRSSSGVRVRMACRRR